MKSFFVAVLLFSVLLCFIIYNYFRINSISERLCRMVDELPPPGTPECYFAALLILNEWNAVRDFVSFSCGVQSLDSIENLVDELVLYSRTERNIDFELTKQRLINALLGISEFESLRPADIF